MNGRKTLPQAPPTGRPGRRRERGEIPVEVAILAPALMLLLAAAVQVGMWYQARETAHAAAVAGVHAARTLNAPAGSGQRAAQAYLDTTAGVLHDGTVHVDASTQRVTITVSGRVAGLLHLPGLTTVEQSASASRERWVTP